MKSELLVKRETIEMEGIRMLSLPACLIHCSANTYVQNTMDARTTLSLITDSSEILSLLLEVGHSTIAGLLAGAFRNNGQDRVANDIIKTMKTAGYDIRESDPFETKLQVKLFVREKSPYVNRIKLM